MKNQPSLTLETNGLSFHAYEEGSGPVALCLHGFPDHARSFRDQLDPLARAGYRAIAPTLRGYEPCSQPQDGDYHIDEVIAGETVGDVLGHVEYASSDLIRRMRAKIETALRDGAITLDESRQLMETYRRGLGGYTYLGR